jgi:hypothetical protein
VVGKLQEAMGQLLGRPDVGALIVVYTTGDRTDAQTSTALEAFASEMGDTIDGYLAQEVKR